eukprot:1137579-Pelagomonas_calceolata.AAC.1
MPSEICPVHPHLYRTVILYNQKHAVCFKRSTNPLCPLPGCHDLDNALCMLSVGCSQFKWVRDGRAVETRETNV